MASWIWLGLREETSSLVPNVWRDPRWLVAGLQGGNSSPCPWIRIYRLLELLRKMWRRHDNESMLLYLLLSCSSESSLPFLQLSRLLHLRCAMILITCDWQCQRCRRRKIKCSGWTEEQPRCLGCIKANQDCQFVNRINVAQPLSNPSPHQQQHQSPLISPGLGGGASYRPWSPTTQSPSSRTFAQTGPSGGGSRRTTAPYHPYAPPPSQQSPYGSSPQYVSSPWTTSPQEDSYAGTGYHHLLDPQIRGTSGGGMDSSPNIAMGGSNLAQRRLAAREGHHPGTAYLYDAPGGPGGSPLPSPLTIPNVMGPKGSGGGAGYQMSSSSLGEPSSAPAEDTGYGKLMYAPFQPNAQGMGLTPSSAVSMHAPPSQLQTPSSATHFPPHSPSSQSAHSYPTPSPQSATQPPPSQQYAPQGYGDPQSRLSYSDPGRSYYMQDTRNQSYSQPASHPSQEFLIPAQPRRPTLQETTPQSSTSTVVTYSTSSHPSTTLSSNTAPTATTPGEYPRSTAKRPSPPHDARTSASEVNSLTPQALADHTQVQDTIREQHIDTAKNVLKVDNGKDVQVIEYLDTLPPVPPTTATGPGSRPASQHSPTHRGLQQSEG